MNEKSTSPGYQTSFVCMLLLLDWIIRALWFFLSNTLIGVVATYSYCNLVFVLQRKLHLMLCLIIHPEVIYKWLHLLHILLLGETFLCAFKLPSCFNTFYSKFSPCKLSNASLDKIDQKVRHLNAFYWIFSIKV